jgi:hypothetical protein
MDEIIECPLPPGHWLVAALGLLPVSEQHPGPPTRYTRIGKWRRYPLPVWALRVVHTGRSPRRADTVGRLSFASRAEAIRRALHNDEDRKILCAMLRILETEDEAADFIEQFAAGSIP